MGVEDEQDILVPSKIRQFVLKKQKEEAEQREAIIDDLMGDGNNILGEQRNTASSSGKRKTRILQGDNTRSSEIGLFESNRKSISGRGLLPAGASNSES